MFARDVQALSMVWDELTGLEARRVLTLIERTLAQPRASLVELEGALALVMCLLTGRRFGELHGARISLEPYWPQAEPPAGLVRAADHWGWFLPAGAPPAGRKVHLWLPAPTLLVDCVRRARARRRDAADDRLFTGTAEDVEAAARTLLAAPEWRRAATTLEAVSRWLGHRLTQVAGGDAAVAAIITARTSFVAKTSLYYTCCDQEMVSRLWWAALDGILPDQPRDAPPALRARRFGSSFCPEPPLVECLRKRLQGDLDRATGLADRSNAFVRYAAVLLSLGMALRPAGRPVTVRAIPGQHDVAIIDDTRDGDPMMTRLAWMTPAVRGQLAELRLHATRLGLHVPDGDLALVMIRDGTPRPATLLDVLSELPEVPSQLKHNFARHFVRSALVGRCSTETLQALLGHWNSGTQPWGPASGLDPILYRADLARSLPALVDEAGWTTVAAPLL